MRPIAAWSLVVALTAATAATLLGPWPMVLVLALVAAASVRGRAGFLLFAALSVAINAALLAWLQPGADPRSLWGITWGLDGLMHGAVGGLRLVAVVGVNLAAVQRAPLAAWLEGLRLGRRPTAFLAAVLMASRDVGRDLDRMRRAQVLDGAWPEGRIDRLRAVAALMPGMLVAAWRRARTRSEALWLAGIRVGPDFAPIVAVTALALAGRLAFVAVPNVALTYVVVFAGGVAFGARVGAWSGAWSMALSDLMLSGLAPAPFANVPAMALLGAAGGLFARLGGQDARTWAAVAGIVGTLLFSMLSDVFTWLLVAEFRTSLALLWIRVAAGLVFNVVPAAANGVLFALVVGPVARAFAALRATQQDGAGHQGDERPRHGV